MEQKWEVDDEDTAELVESENKEEPIEGDDDDENLPNIPVFTLLMNLRPQYKEGTAADAAILDTEKYCETFDRIMSCDVIDIGTHKGMVFIWAGASEDDREETIAEITSFMENCPMVTQDVVDKWELFDMVEDDEESMTPISLPGLGEPDVAF